MHKARDTYKEERPWGSFETFALNIPCTVKILTVKAGEAFSLQYHHKREEYWRVLSGSGEIRVGEETFAAHPGDSFSIPQGALHRATGGSEDMTILEVATGEFDENDIVRTEDRYGRNPVPSSNPGVSV